MAKKHDFDAAWKAILEVFEVEFEERVISCDLFYSINDNIVRKHKLNDAIDIETEGFRYDTSVERQKGVMNIINDDIEKIYKLCKEYKREMPTEIKIIINEKS